MNLLYISKTSLLSEGGGGEKRAREVTRRLNERGHDVMILSGKTGPDLPKRTNLNGCTVRHVKCIPDWLFRYPTASFYASRYLFALWSLPILVRLLRRLEIDVVIENMTPYPTLSVVVVRAWDVGIVAVQHEFFDSSAFEIYDPLTATIQLLVQNILRVFRFDRIIVPTSHVRNQLVAYGVRSPVEVIPNGIDVSAFQEHSIDPEPNRLVTVGRLSKRKGHDDVLRAVARIEDEVPGVQLDVLGKGPREIELARLADELEISERVHFHGFVDDEEKVKLLCRGQVFVFASRQEGFGLVLLEAMAAGLPVVARRLPVYGDFFESSANGYLVEEPVIEKLATRIQELLADDEQREAISKRNRRVASQYDWEATATQTAEVIESASRTDGFTTDAPVPEDR